MRILLSECLSQTGTGWDGAVQHLSLLLANGDRCGDKRSLKAAFKSWSPSERPPHEVSRVWLHGKRLCYPRSDYQTFVDKAADKGRRGQRERAIAKIGAGVQPQRNYNGFQKTELLPYPHGQEAVTKQARAIHACDIVNNAAIAAYIDRLEELFYRAYPVAKCRTDAEICALINGTGGDYYGTTDMSAFDRSTGEPIRVVLRACLGHLLGIDVAYTKLSDCHGRFFVFTDHGSVHSGERLTSFFAVLTVLAMQLIAAACGYTGRPINCGDDNITVVSEPTHDDYSANLKYLCAVGSWLRSVGLSSIGPSTKAPSPPPPTRNPDFLVRVFRLFGYDCRVESVANTPGEAKFLQRWWQADGAIYTDVDRATARLMSSRIDPASPTFPAYYRGKLWSYGLTYPRCPVIATLAAEYFDRFGPVSDGDINAYEHAGDSKKTPRTGRIQRPLDCDYGRLAHLLGCAECELRRFEQWIVAEWLLPPTHYTTRDVNEGLYDFDKINALSQIIEALPTEEQQPETQQQLPSD